MLIGSQYADNKMYRGIKHFDKMPLTSEDIHEHSDTSYMKNAYIMNNLVGYGTLNNPRIDVSSRGISIEEPAVVLIDGDVSLIQSDKNTPLILLDSIKNLGYEEGIICIVGWYQYLSTASVLRNYGGVDNSRLENDLHNEKFGLQISGRYQLRWFPIILDKDTYLSESNIIIEDRDIDGNKLDTTSTLVYKESKNRVLLYNAPESMEYADSDIYLVPIINYKYDTSSDSITEIDIAPKVNVGSPLVTSNSRPEGTFTTGTVWYNPTTQEFRTYIEEVGEFIANASKMAYLQYQSIYTIDSEVETSQDIIVPIDISELLEGDVLQVAYEGLLLISGEHYSVNYADNTITLLDFTTHVGDHVYFTVTKTVEASGIMSITATFTNHMSKKASSTLEGHVKLSDIEDPELDASSGVAATPHLVHSVKESIDESIENLSINMTNTLNNKMSMIDESITITRNTLREEIEASSSSVDTKIENSKKIIDSTTNTSYVLGVEGGLIFLEEV